MISFKALFYIFKELFGPFLLSFSLFLMTILMVQAFRFTDIILLFGTNVDSVLLLLKSLLISTFPIILPLSLLAALLLGYGRMGQDSELVAMSSLGVKPWHMMVPGVFLACVVFVASFFCATELGPLGVRASKILSNQLASTTLKSSLKPGVFLSFSNMTVYVEDFDNETQAFENFFVLDARKEKSALILSKKGACGDFA